MNVITKKVWSEINIVIYSFFRVGDSLIRWDWLAMIISGSSHMVSINSGVDRESEKYVVERFKLLSLNWLSRGRLTRVIIRLWVVVLIQIMLFFDNHVRGMSITVGIIIFSIVRGLGFVRGRRHMCLKPLLVGIGLGLLRRLRRLA